MKDVSIKTKAQKEETEINDITLKISPIKFKVAGNDKLHNNKNNKIQRL